jgi:subtilase family serine protease
VPGPWSRVALLVVGYVMLAAPPGSAALVRQIPAPGPCTNPAAAGDGATPFTGGLDPNQLAAAYDVTPLEEAGYDGAGQTIAVIENGESLYDGTDEPGLTPTTNHFAELNNCYGPLNRPDEELVPGTGSTPPVNRKEGIFDPEVVAAIAPGAQIYELEAGAGQQLQTVLPTLLKAALDPPNTGGRLVDSITMSYAVCELLWTPDQIAAVERVLIHASRLGVSVFAASGDAGSIAYFTSDGQRGCIEGPNENEYGPPSTTDTDFKAGISYPASSPQVTSVGGTELYIDGELRNGSPDGGTITSEQVWDEPYGPSLPGLDWSGNGGVSSLFSVSDAPWERLARITGAEQKPDIAAMAGSPQYLFGGIGTSGASPLMAGAIADLDGFLEAHHSVPVGPLNPTLYHIYAHPTLYAQVFNDITMGTNDGTDQGMNLGCCTAAVGYDDASGLGSLNISGLGKVLLEHPRLRVPWLPLKLGVAPLSSVGVPLAVTAVTDDVFAGTNYRLNIFVGGKFLTSCRRRVCTASFSGRPGQRIEVAADVGRKRAAPYGVGAIVTEEKDITIHFARPCPTCTT